jgi:hypothetical protein
MRLLRLVQPYNKRRLYELFFEGGRSSRLAHLVTTGVCECPLFENVSSTYGVSRCHAVKSIDPRLDIKEGTL